MVRSRGWSLEGGPAGFWHLMGRCCPQDGGEELTPWRHTFLPRPAGQENREV